MKKYSYTIRRKREADAKMVSVIKKGDELVREQVGPADRAPSYEGEITAIISSEEFINNFKGYVEDIALFKTVKGRKYMRSTEYAAVGIMDQNDLIQEAYLAFLEAYANVDWGKVKEEADSEGAMVWSFIKKTMILNFERSLRQQKDGVRIPEYMQIGTENLVTKLFSQLEKVFFRNQEDVALTSWETDLTGAFLEVHMDEYLDLTRNGNRDFKKNERAILKALFGIDQPVKTYKEVSEYYNISQSTIRKVKERAIKRLQTEESKEKIADFLHGYRINTHADTEKYRK